MQIIFESQEELDKYVAAANHKEQRSMPFDGRSFPPIRKLSVAELISGLSLKESQKLLGLTYTSICAARRRSTIPDDKLRKLIAAAEKCDKTMFWLRVSQYHARVKA